MKFRRTVVLAHHPGSRLSDLTSWAFRRVDDLGIKLLHVWIALLNPRFNLRQRVLNVARVLFVSKVLRDFFIREVAAKPSGVPGQEWNDDEERRQNDQRPG